MTQTTPHKQIVSELLRAGFHIVRRTPYRGNPSIYTHADGRSAKVPSNPRLTAVGRIIRQAGVG